MAASGNETNPDCSKLDDPDITGLLVILAFVISLIITFCTVLYTYLSISLPRTAYHGFDALVIPDRAVRRLPAIIQTLPGDRKAEIERNERNAQRKLAAWTSLVLAMSDQHLVTGTAMLITSYAITGGAGGLDRQRSVYSLRIATSLATCAAIVHISTLSVLRFRFRHQTVDSALRHVAIVIFVGLTFGARIASSFTSSHEDSKCVSESSVKRDFASATDHQLAMMRVAATVLEMAGLWICLYRSLKACLHVGGLRSLVRLCLRRKKLETHEEERIQNDREKFLSETRGLRPLLMIMKFCESSLIDMLWMSLFFGYSLVEIGRIYVGRVATNPDGKPPDIVIEPSFGQLMPMLVLTGSLLGVLTAWIETNPEPSPDPKTNQELSTVRKKNRPSGSGRTSTRPGQSDTTDQTKNTWKGRLQAWITRKFGDKSGDQMFHSSDTWAETNRFTREYRRLAWIVFITGTVAMTGLVFIRIRTTTDVDPVPRDVVIWHSVFMAAVGLYFVLHVFTSVILAIDDAGRADG
ncbi:hypothetical protein PG996_009337 [Apiospora saccharicola]|uniref:Uncharacterized protein n=1 Tax=Apiospora saccharicola TaxID=335842 RepID=A0ABR1UL19_9PEZI